MAMKFPGISAPIQSPVIKISMGPSGPKLESNSSEEMCMLMMSQMLAEMIAQHVGAKPKSNQPQIVVPGGM